MLLSTRRRKEHRSSRERVSNASGVKASAYHVGPEEEVRTRVQDTFARGAVPVVCATNAFGMGIDRPDVDAVVHYAIPGSLEAAHQEHRTRQRDGRAATATLLWDPADVATREHLIDSPRRIDATGGRRPRSSGSRASEGLRTRKLRRDDRSTPDSAACLRLRHSRATSATPPPVNGATPRQLADRRHRPLRA